MDGYRVDVGADPTLVAKAGGPGGPAKRLKLRNPAALTADIFLGGPDVGILTGYLLPQGESEEVEIDPEDELYAVWSGPGTTRLDVLEGVRRF